jgi:hypothetical protein
MTAPLNDRDRNRVLPLCLSFRVGTIGRVLLSRLLPPLHCSARGRQTQQSASVRWPPNSPTADGRRSDGRRSAMPCTHRSAGDGAQGGDSCVSSLLGNVLLPAGRAARVRRVLFRLCASPLRPPFPAGDSASEQHTHRQTSLQLARFLFSPTAGTQEAECALFFHAACGRNTTSVGNTHTNAQN